MNKVRRVKCGSSYCYIDPARVIAVLPTFRTNGVGAPEQSGVSIVCEHQANIELEGGTPEDAMCDLGYGLFIRSCSRIDNGDDEHDGELIAVDDHRKYAVTDEWSQSLGK